MKAVCVSVHGGAETSSFAQGLEKSRSALEFTDPLERVRELLEAATPSRVCMKLAKDQIWRVQIEERPVTLRVLEGTVWITEDGQYADHIVKATPGLGPVKFVLSRQGGATVSALKEATVEIG